MSEQITVAPTRREAIAAPSRRGAKLREAQFEDFEQISALERRFGLGGKTYEQWLHLWLGNPLFRQRKGHWPIGWVLEAGDGTIVGSMGNIPLLYELDGRRIVAASGRHWVTETAHRSQGILLLDRLITQPHINLYVNTTVSSASLPAVIALGCSRVPSGVWDEVAYWITSYLGCLKGIIGSGSQLGHSLREASRTNWKATGARLLKLLRRHLSGKDLKDRLIKKSPRRMDIEISICPDFDDRFDRFWEELKTNHRHQLLAVRSREFLEWHFKYALLKNELWIATIEHGRRLLAYAIFLKTVHPQFPIRPVKLIDYRSLDGKPELLEHFLCWALARCHSEGMHMLEFEGRWVADKFISQLAPFRRKLPAWRYFYRVSDPRLGELLKNEEAWAPSLFDGDATL